MFETQNNDTYAKMMKAYTDNNAEVINKLEGQVSAGGQLGFEKGDKIEWPKEAKYLKIPVGNSGRKAQAILCKITNTAGVERYQPFFINALQKPIRTIEKDTEGNVLKELDFVYPQGQPSEDFRSQANMSINDVFVAMMKEHPNGISVVDYENIDTPRFNDRSKATTARRYTYAYV